MWDDGNLLSNKPGNNYYNNPVGGGAYQPPPVNYGQLDPR